MTVAPSAAAAIAVPGLVVYNNAGTTVAVCDADSSQAATSLLRPLGALAQGVASGDEVQILTGSGVPLVSTGAVQEGDMLICEDGEGGKVIPVTPTVLNTLFADGDEIYVVGVAEETTAGAGGVLANVAPYLFSHSEP